MNGSFWTKVAAKNQRRWYSAQLQDNLFGGVDLVCRWGRLGFCGGQRRVVQYADEAAAQAALLRVAHQRLRRGYRRRLPKQP